MLQGKLGRGAEKKLTSIAFTQTHQDPRVVYEELHTAPYAQSILKASTPAQVPSIALQQADAAVPVR